MNYQRSTTEHKRFGLRSVIVFMLVLVALVCCFTVSASADEVTVSVSDLVIGADNEVVTNGIRYYTKVYDGTKDVVGTVALADDFDDTPYANNSVKIVIDKVELDAADAGAAFLTVTFKLENDTAEQYSAPTPVVIPAKIAPLELTWADGVEASASVAYQYNALSYEITAIGDKSLTEFFGENLVGVLEGETVEIPDALFATLNANAPGTYNTVIEAINLGNYTTAPLGVEVTVEKLGINKIDWGTLEYVYGDEAVYGIDATVTDTAGKTWIVPVSYLQKNADGEWEPVDRISGGKGEYQIYIADISDANGVIAVPAWDDEENGASVTKTIKITHKKYKVEMNDALYVGDADLTTGENTTKFFVGVTGIGENVPQSILSQIKYYDAEGNPFNGATAYGETVVTAKLPTSATDDFSFVNASGKKITSLTATITINRLYVSAGSEEGKTDVVIMNNANGFDADAKAEVKLPEFDRNVLRGFPVHSEFTLSLKGVDKKEALVLYIPHNESLYSKHAEALTADDLYVFDSEKNELVKASERYTVTMLDGYYRVEGYTAADEITFVTAPVYNTPFWLSAPGIALIVLIVLVIVLLLFFIGLKSRKAASKEVNEPTVVDTVGERYEGKTTMVEGAPAPPAINVDSLVAELEAEEEAEEQDDEALNERTREAVADSMQTLADEASQIVLPQEDLTPAEEATNALAAKLSDELDETVGPDREEVQYDVEEGELKEAVADAMKMAVNESADATDAVALIVEEEPEAVEPEPEHEPVAEEALVEEILDEEPEAVEAFAETSDTEEDDDNDDGDDEDEDGSFGLSTAGLTFIDVSAEPEAYKEMLDQERQGQVKIVYRYRRSFTSRMVQSQGNVQDYYTAIKNLLLSYKGIKGRVSWNYEAFNRGRAHVAKLNAKTKTLYLYLALNPEELADTKYGIVDMSSKKKYASVPVLMKIKGERKFKYALELIEKLCGEELALKQIENYEDVDYRMPYKTTDELVEEGAMKMYAAAIPMTEVTEG